MFLGDHDDDDNNSSGEEEEKNDLLVESIADAQKRYFASHAKKSFFGKNAQKLACAATVAESFTLEQLMHCAIWRVEHYPGSGTYTNAVAVDYLLLKTFACPENYARIAQYGLQKINESLAQYGNYQVHFNLKSFSATAMERYAGLVDSFFGLMSPTDAHFCQCLQSLTVYNAPSFFQMLHKMVHKFITSDSSTITTNMVSKQDSDQEFAKIAALRSNLI